MITSSLTEIAANGEYEEIGGRNVLRTAGDTQEEYRALREGAMFYDCSAYGLFTLRGEGADRFLEKLATKDIQYLNEGNVSECYFLNEEAEIVGSVFILRREDSFVVIAPWEHADPVEKWMKEKSGEEAVEIEQMSDTAAITIEGPESWRAVQELFSADITGIGLRSSDIITWEGEDITVIRVGRTSEYGYVIMASVEKAKEIYRLMREGEWDFPVKEGGLDALELAMLEVHQPNFIRETEEFGDIFELAQQWYIQYDKEDYTGWERLMEKFSNGVKKGAVGFSAAADSELPAGCEVTDGTDTIGRVVYGRYSYKLEKFLGIAVLDNPYAEAGLKLTAKGTNGDEEINTLSGPFIRPLSWDMKME